MSIESRSKVRLWDRQDGAGVIVSLIGNTTNHGGLVARARLDRRNYPTGKKASAKDLRELRLERDDFHGDWNYVVKP